APRSLAGFRPIATGLSGGVTLLGTAATVAGAIVVASVSQFAAVAAFWPVAIGGVAGALVDSLLGATLQAQRWCSQCARPCETGVHRCGSQTALRRGLQWVENDAVNVAATLTGALIAGSLAAFAAKSR
ncbi:MAG: DUF92 domain-containing protein, partial [Candidatus Tumulicola sp.]